MLTRRDHLLHKQKYCSTSKGDFLRHYLQSTIKTKYLNFVMRSHSFMCCVCFSHYLGSNWLCFTSFDLIKLQQLRLANSSAKLACSHSHIISCVKPFGALRTRLSLCETNVPTEESWPSRAKFDVWYNIWMNKGQLYRRVREPQ